MTNWRPKHQKSGAILTRYPQPLALAYQTLLEALDAGRLAQALTSLHSLCEKTLTYCCILLDVEILRSTRKLTDIQRNSIKNIYLKRTMFGEKIDHLQQLTNGSGSTDLCKLFRRSGSAELLNVLEALNRAYKPAAHHSIIDEPFAVELLDKFLDPIVRVLARQEIFTEHELVLPCKDGRQTKLTGCHEVEYESTFDEEKVLITRNGGIVANAWPLLVVRRKGSLVRVYNLARIESAGREQVKLDYFDAFASERFSVISRSDESLFKSLNDLFGNLQIGPGRNYLDDFSDLRERIRDFSGRTWLFKDVNDFVNDLAGGQTFLILGKPGTGKSSFMVQHMKRTVADDPQISRGDYSYFFFRDGEHHRNRLTQWMKHVTDDLEAKTGISLRFGRKSFEPLPNDDVNKLMWLIQRIRDEDPDRAKSPIVFFVDGIDELQQEDIATFVDSINALRTIENVGLVLASREIRELDRIAGPLVKLRLEDDARNLQDLQFYAETRLPSWTEEEIAELISRTGCVFLYLSATIDDVLHDRLARGELSSLPGDLESYYDRIMRFRMPERFSYHGLVWEETGLRALALMIALQVRPTVEMLARYSGIGIEKLRRTLDLLRELLIIPSDRPSGYPQSEGSHETEGIRVFHKSFEDFLEKTNAPEIRRAHDRIVNHFLPMIREDRFNRPEPYFFYYYLRHLKITSRLEILSEVVHCKSQFRERVKFLLGGKKWPDEDSSWYSYFDEYPDCNGDSAMLLLLLSSYLREVVLEERSLALRVLLLRLTRLFPVWRTLTRFEHRDYGATSEVPLWHYQMLLMLASRAPLLARSWSMRLAFWREHGALIVLLDCGLKEIITGKLLDDIGSEGISPLDLGRELWNSILASPSHELKEFLEQASIDSAWNPTATEWKMTINVDEIVLTVENLGKLFSRDDEYVELLRDFLNRFAKDSPTAEAMRSGEMSDEAELPDEKTKLALMAAALCQLNPDDPVDIDLLTSFLTRSRFATGMRLLIASQLPEELQQLIIRNDALLNVLYSDYRTFVDKMLESGEYTWILDGDDDEELLPPLPPEFLKTVVPWLRKHIPTGIDELDSRIMEWIGAIEDPKHFLIALEFFLGIVRAENVPEALAKTAMAAYWKCVGIKEEEGTKPTYYNSTFFNKVSELLHGRYHDELMKLFVERVDYCLQSRAFIYQNYVKPKDHRLQPIKDALYNACVRDLKVFKTVRGKPVYANVFSIDLPDSGDFYLDRLCDDDENYAEELNERADKRYEEVVGQLLFGDLGRKTLLPSQCTQLNEIINNAFDCGWSTNELLNSILDAISSFQKRASVDA